MFNYEGTDYSSKAECVRVLFDKGEVDMTASSKKALAAKLEMTVQTVHATLVKHSTGGSEPKKARQSRNHAINKVAVDTILSSKKLIVVGDRSVDEQKILIKKYNPHKFEVTSAPNPWGLPIINPPMIVLDERFTKETINNWEPEPETILYDPEQCED